jgi:hypothetical protein
MRNGDDSLVFEHAGPQRSLQHGIGFYIDSGLDEESVRGLKDADRDKTYSSLIQDKDVGRSKESARQ